MEKYCSTAILRMLIGLMLMGGAVHSKIYFWDNVESKDKWEESSYSVSFRPGIDDPTDPSFYPLRHFELSPGWDFINADLEMGLVATFEKSRYAISANFAEPFDNLYTDFVLQYQVKIEKNQSCGGAYVKILEHGINQNLLNKDTPYLLMFGPDICDGNAELQIIFRKPGDRYLKWKKYMVVPTDNFHHFYTLILRKDGTYTVKIDGETKARGYIKDDWDMGEPETIPDPNAKKPASFDDKPYIYDPVKEAKLANVSMMIDDVNDQKPRDWDEREKGVWTRRQIINPDYLVLKEQIEKAMLNKNYQV